MHILKSKILLTRALVLCVIWIAVALVYYGLIIGLAWQLKVNPDRSFSFV